MVTGIRKFREHFAAHESQYAIIGGAACDLLFNAAGLDFRATKDIDMVLCVEVVDAAFGRTFGAFLDAGGYQARERSDGVREFYRFHRPTDQSFPFMIELFARRPGNLDLPDDARLARIPVDEDIVSLSAILLDENYFEALQAARRQIDGITIIDETLLIPFKARACLDLTARLEAGGNVDRKDIRKHRQRCVPVGATPAPGRIRRPVGARPPGPPNLCRQDAGRRNAGSQGVRRAVQPKRGGPIFSAGCMG